VVGFSSANIEPLTEGETGREDPGGPRVALFLEVEERIATSTLECHEAGISVRCEPFHPLQCFFDFDLESATAS
jgi:hypothetical protein